MELSEKHLNVLLDFLSELTTEALLDCWNLKN